MPDREEPTTPEPAPDAPDDHSGAGRPRRDDEEFPEHRSFQEMGTHEVIVPPGHGES
jgi:hypothetical protein